MLIPIPHWRNFSFLSPFVTCQTLWRSQHEDLKLSPNCIICAPFLSFFLHNWFHYKFDRFMWLLSPKKFGAPYSRFSPQFLITCVTCHTCLNISGIWNCTCNSTSTVSGDGTKRVFAKGSVEGIGGGLSTQSSTYITKKDRRLSLFLTKVFYGKVLVALFFVTFW